MLELSRELIGAIALGSFWVHSLLIAAAEGRDWLALVRLGRARVRGGVVRSGCGLAGTLASNTVDQIGRSKGDGVVHFNDAGYRNEVFGGVVELDDGSLVELPATTTIAVWPDLGVRSQQAGAGAAAQLDQALVEARRGRGWSRSVDVSVGVGQRVFVVDHEPGEPSILAAIDPRGWLARKRWLIVGFVIAHLAIATACTSLVMWPPVFGMVSMLGAAAALGWFLAVQPLGVAVTEAVRTPDRAYLRGRWG